MPGSRAAAAKSQSSRGAAAPNNGPDQATAKGRGFSAKSVREMTSGCRMTRATRPRGNLVQLKVYDVTGREVQTLVNERLQPGTYEASFDGSALNTGVYFYKLVTGNFSETKKMLLIK